MKKMINYAFITLLMFAFMGVSSVYGQEWSKDQKEVWKEIEKGWAAWQKGDTETAFAGVHEKYLGWNSEDPLPISKAKWKSKQEQGKGEITIGNYDIQPARIVVDDDYATVYYFFEFTISGKENWKKSFEGRNVEFYVKEKGKWLLFGDMSYFEEDDD